MITHQIAHQVGWVEPARNSQYSGSSHVSPAKTPLDLQRYDGGSRSGTRGQL
jgi:hypothetical protein